MRILMLLAILASVSMAGTSAQGPVPRVPQMEKTTVGAELFRL
jgi:hypothetical protein